jgi:hypothetical protein
MPNAPAIGWRNGFRSPARKVIDWTHPMAADLVSYHVPGGASTAKDLCGRFDIPAHSAVASHGTTKFGPGMVNTADNQGSLLVIGDAHPLCLQPPLTVMTAFVVNSTPNGRAFYYGSVYSQSGFSPYVSYGFANAGFDAWFALQYNDGTNLQEASWTGANFSTPGVRVCVGTITSAGTALWVNGARRATGAGTSTILYRSVGTGSASTLAVFSDPGTTRTANTTWNAGAVWNRALTDAEIIRLSADPFLFLKA